jgi:hypothetical protein
MFDAAVAPLLVLIGTADRDVCCFIVPMYFIKIFAFTQCRARQVNIYASSSRLARRQTDKQNNARRQVLILGQLII